MANRSLYIASLRNGKTPDFILHGKETDISLSRTIGARVFIHVEQRTTKLHDEAWEGKLVGYYADSRRVRVYNPKTNRVIESRNVTFIEPPPYK